MRSVAIIVVTAIIPAFAELPPEGALRANVTTVTEKGRQPRSGVVSRDYLITYPEGASAGDRFPLVVYAHGFLEGEPIEEFYTTHLTHLAEYGYVIIAPKSCPYGCSPWFAEDPEDHRANRGTRWGMNHSHLALEDGETICLPKWDTFKWEMGRAVTYARNQSDRGVEWAAAIDWDAGIAVAGHGMGGDGAVGMAAEDFAEKFDVKAMVCQHCWPCENTGADVTVPSLWMSGTTDVTVPAFITRAQYELTTAIPRSWRNEQGSGHLEMMTPRTDINSYNRGLAAHTAAFLNVYLKGDEDEFYDQIYGNSSISFCNYAETEECEHVNSAYGSPRRPYRAEM